MKTRKARTGQIPSYFRPKHLILCQNAELQNKPDFSSWKTETGGGRRVKGAGRRRGREEREKGDSWSEFTYRNGLPILPKLNFHGPPSCPQRNSSNEYA
jgi:hypothetical protein